jgi:hypothetical protein
MAKRKIKKTVSKKKEPNWKALFFVALFAFVGLGIFSLNLYHSIGKIPGIYKISMNKNFGQEIGEGKLHENSSYIKVPGLGGYVWSASAYKDYLGKLGKMKEPKTGGGGKTPNYSSGDNNKGMQ